MDAREAYTARGAEVDYRNVKRDAAALRDMLALTDGVRKVPVIVEDGRVTVGYGGS